MPETYIKEIKVAPNYDFKKIQRLSMKKFLMHKLTDDMAKRCFSSDSFKSTVGFE